MKRIISLVLTMVLLVACLALPVMADEIEQTPYFELLDYIDNPMINYSPNTSFRLYFPYQYRLNGIDVLINFSSGVVPSASYVKVSSSTYTMEMIHVSGNVYRLIAKPTRTSNYLEFSFDVPNDIYFNFLSVKVYYSGFSAIDTTVSGSINVMGLPNQYLYPTYPGNPYVNWSYTDYEQYEGANTFGSFTGRFDFDEWQKFDYLQLQLNLIISEIVSISAFIGDVAVPLEVSYLGDADQVGNYYLNVFADVSSFDHSSDLPLTIQVNGCGHFQLTNQISIFDAVGFIKAEDPNQLVVLFSSLFDFISTGFASVNSSLSSLGTNVSGWIGAQTSSLTTAIVNQQTAIINAQQAQHEADRQLWNTISSNVNTWISNQTVTLNDTLVGINNNIKTFRTNVGTWVASQTLDITNSISSWGQSIINSINSGADRIVAALSPNGSADDFNDKVQQQGSALEDMAGAMGAVIRPDVSTAIPDIGGYLTVSGPVTLAAVFDPFWKNSYILRLLLGSLAVSVAFTVVYGGKK